MEFEEMKKIWDQQNEEPMYAINEEALHNRIRTKNRSAGRRSNINDIGLIFIAIATAAILLLIGKDSFYDYVSAVALLLIAVYVFMGRVRRKKLESQFDRTILGDLDQAIANVSYEVTRTKTFFWWFLLPVAIPTLLNMAQAGAPTWKWFLVPVAFVVSFLLVRWELRRRHLPQKHYLESLRDILTNDLNGNSQV